MTSRVIQRVAILILLASAASGCDAYRLGEKIGEAQNWPKVLKAYATAYSSFHAQAKRPPKSWRELENGGKGLTDRVRLAFEKRKYTALFNVRLDEIRVGADKFILAYPHDAHEQGGQVLTLDGQLHELSAQEFNQRFPAQMEGVQSWPHRLVTIKDDQALAVDDEVLVGRITYDGVSREPESHWRKAKVMAALPGGAVQCKLAGYSRAEIVERWQLRRIEPRPSLTDPNEASGKSPAQAEHYLAVEKLRSEKTAQALAAAVWPQRDLIELDPKKEARAGDLVYAPFQSRMQPVRIDSWPQAAAVPVRLEGTPPGADSQATIRCNRADLRRRVRKPWKEMHDPLMAFAAAYSEFSKALQRAPETWDELETEQKGYPYRPLDSAIWQAFDKHGFEPVLGVTGNEMLGGRSFGGPELEQRLGRFILAYPKSAPLEGGLVLADASLREFTAEEFQKSLAAQSEALAKFRSSMRQRALAFCMKANGKRLVELAADKPLKPGDTVYVPAGEKMTKALVMELLAGGGVLVKLDDPRLRPTYESWELRNEPYEEPVVSLSLEEREAQRRAKLTQSLRDYAAAYADYYRKHHAAPKNWQEISSVTDIHDIQSRLDAASYDVVFAVHPVEMTVGLANFILAYPREARSEGGLVAIAAGGTRQLTAAEFTKLFNAQLSGIAAKRNADGKPPAAKSRTPASRAPSQMFGALSEAWINFNDLAGRGPVSWEELESKTPTKGLRRRFETADYEVVFGLNLRSIDPARTVLAYPQSAAEKGGHILLADGAAKELTAEEFRAIFAEQSKALEQK